MKTKISILLALLFSMGALANAQSAPENLTAEVDHNGYVVLKWTSPTGQFPSSYTIRRGHIVPDIVIAQAYGPSLVTQFTDYNVVSGTFYAYGVTAVYSGNIHKTAYVDITVVPPASGLEIVSQPQTTALVGQEYVYAPAVNHERPEDISYTLLGVVPGGMEVRNVVGGAYISWLPTQVGMFKVSLQATNVYTQARDVQEFYIAVGSQTGTLTGFVHTLTNDPIPNALVKFWQVGGNGTALRYSTRTDENGDFRLEYVQAGRIYAYAESPNYSYLSQWYINKTSLETALPWDLGVGETNKYEFHLFPSTGTGAPVMGRVIDEQEDGIVGASVAFIRKENFIHIGDSASLNNVGMSTDLPWRARIADTIVYTDFNGQFSLELPVGNEYYTFVEKDNFIGSFYGDESNALRARAHRISSSGSVMNYKLASQESTQHKLNGKVTSKTTGVSKQATIVIIDTEMKRGAGGGFTYRKYQSVVTDSNGVFQFDNLPEAPPSALLAIPMDTRLAPQYFHENGGRTNFIESMEITPNGTLQDLNFELQETMRNGIGSYSGKVILRRGIDRTPLAGALVVAENEASGEIAGYAITDSVGVYAISGLEPGSYVLYADHMEYSYRTVFSVANPSRPMPINLDYTDSKDPSRNEELNFYIDDLRVATGIDTDALPVSITLYQNYPNPFNPSTTIRYALPSREHVRLRVVNALGEEIALIVNEMQDSGSHSVEFNASDIPSGVYFYQLSAGSTSLSKHMMVTK